MPHQSNLNYFIILTNFVSSISVKELTDRNAVSSEIENYTVEIPELSADDQNVSDNSILPYSKQTFGGFKLLQEYFSFQEKFFFVQISGSR